MLHLPKASGRLSRLRKSRICRLNKILIQCFVWIRVNCIGKTISYLRINHLITQKLPNNFDKRVASPIPFVYWFGLQNLRRHMCCRAIKTTIIGVTVIAYQSLLSNKLGYWPPRTVSFLLTFPKHTSASHLGCYEHPSPPTKELHVIGLNSEIVQQVLNWSSILSTFRFFMV